METSYDSKKEGGRSKRISGILTAKKKEGSRRGEKGEFDLETFLKKVRAL